MSRERRREAPGSTRDRRADMGGWQRSERRRDGAERRAEDGDARFEEARTVVGDRTGWGCGEMARVRRWRVAPSRTRGRARARIARDRGEERERAGEGSEATEPRARAGRGLEACTCKRSAQRASASVGDRDRHPKGEDRVSGLRGAGRGEAAPGGIEPGARSEGPGGRPYVPAGRADDNEPSLITERDDPQAEEIEGSSNRAQSDR